MPSKIYGEFHESCRSGYQREELENHRIKIIDIFGPIHKKTSFSSKFCSTSKNNNVIFLDIQEFLEVSVPMNEESSQSEISTSGPKHRRLYVLKFSRKHITLKVKRA